MNKIHKRRLYYIILLAIGVCIATSLIVYALKKNINVFVTPSQIMTFKTSSDYRFRLGGMVKKGSLAHEKEGLGVEFMVTDFKKDLLVHYVGILPDLFREGSGVIVEGSLNSKGQFIATSILAKHDENYMPKNVYQSLRNENKVLS
jgi:cytochrome c-type biogenesis protein CcmE